MVGRIEVVGGIQIVLATWAAVPAGRVPRTPSNLGVVNGLAGIRTDVPTLFVPGMGFSPVSVVLCNFDCYLGDAVENCVCRERKW